MKLTLAIICTALVCAGGVYYLRGLLYPKELIRNPPQLDGLKKAIIDQVRLEPNITTDGDFGAEDQAERVVVTFVFVPQRFDKTESERAVRELVRAYIPTAKIVDVRFGDNYRTKARERTDADEDELPQRPRRQTPILPKAQNLR